MANPVQQFRSTNERTNIFGLLFVLSNTMRTWILVLVLALNGLTSFAQELPLKKEPVFKEGEVLKYKLKYGFLTAAEATLKVQATDMKFDNKPTYRLVVDAETSGTFDIFYKVRDHYDSFIDKTDLTPYFYQENIREASYRRQDKARFYQDTKKVVANRGTFTTPTTQTFDLVSAYYFARSLDITGLKIGDRFKLNYFLGDEISQLEIQYIGKEVIKTKLGSIRCLKFSPSIKPGRIFKKDSKLYLWITDDGNRVPVKAEVEILVGSVSLEIKSAEGLKYPIGQ
jgi:hypothetical protein